MYGVICTVIDEEGNEVEITLPETITENRTRAANCAAQYNAILRNQPQTRKWMEFSARKLWG